MVNLVRKLDYPCSIKQRTTLLQFKYLHTVKHMLSKQDYYIHPYIRTSSYMNSLYPRTIKEWNALPPNVATYTSLTAF